MHAAIIVFFGAILFAADARVMDDVSGMGVRLDARAVLAMLIGIPAAGALVCELVVAGARRELGRGKPSALWKARRWSGLVRTAILIGSGVCIAWLDGVSVIVDQIGVARWLATPAAAAPGLIGVFVTWILQAPLERMAVSAGLFRKLDAGMGGVELPSPMGYAAAQFRQVVLPVLVPVVLIGVWHAAVSGPIGNVNEYAGVALQLVGVALVICFAPIVLVRTWPTTRIEGGRLDEIVDEVCVASGVRPPAAYQWNAGATLNAAILGVLPRPRYALFSSALLAVLPEAQLRAVVAHEIAHARYAHLLWLIGAAIVAAVLGGWLGLFVIELGGSALAGGAGDVAVILCSITSAVVVFGMVSRRFERQADAFAASSCARSEGMGVVGESHAAAVQSALALVTRANGVPAGRFSFRHGSIESRIRSLGRTVGRRVNRTGADRAAGHAKWAIFLGAAAIGVLLVLDGVLGLTAPPVPV